MSKVYSEKELRDIGMDEGQIVAIMSTQQADVGIPTSNATQLVQIHKHDVEVHTDNSSLVPTSLKQIASYKDGTIVELPPFADGQPFVARVKRPSMLSLMKSGKIPNSLLSQATSLFANGAQALNGTGKNATSASELFDVVDVVVDAALLEPTLSEIRSVGMELSDDQLMAIFSYTQKGAKALEQFRTV